MADIKVPIAKPIIGEEEIKNVVEVLKSGMIAQGPKVAEFEEKFAAWIGTKYAIATNSGTSALHVALLAAGIGKGDEVITTPFTFIATGNSIIYTGATPVFADIDLKTYTIDPDSIEALITDKTKAILPVQLYGQSADMDRINEIADKHGITPAQVSLVWILSDKQRIAIPKTSNPEHLQGNLDAVKVTLSADELEKIGSLARSDGRKIKHPDYSPEWDD